MEWVLSASKHRPRTWLILLALGSWGRWDRERDQGGRSSMAQGQGEGGGLRLGGLERLICTDRGSSLCGAVPPLPAGHRRQCR